MSTSIQEAGLERLCYVMRGTEGFGVLRAMETLGQALRERGVGVSAVSLQQGPAADHLTKLGWSITSLDLDKPPHFRGGLFAKAQGVWRARRYKQAAVPLVADAISRQAPDVVQVLWPNLVSLVGKAAQQAGVRCVWEMPNVVATGLPLDLNRRLYQQACRRHDILVLSNSRFTGDTLRGRGVEPITFHLGVDAKRFDPDRVQPISRESLGIPPQAITVGIVARIDQRKGQRQLLEAACALMTSGHDIHLVFVGGPTEGATAEGLREIAARIDAADRLHLIDLVDTPEQYYALMDVAVNNFLGAEAFGLSVVEAMMMATPVLVHALGGPAETVIDGTTGWHYAPPTVENLTAALERVIKDRPNWPTMAQAARQHALEHFTADAQADRYLAALATHHWNARPERE